MNKFFIGTCGVLLTACAAWVVAQETMPAGSAAKGSGTQAASPGSLAEQYSYAIGLDMGQQFRKRETPLDVQGFVAGLQAGLQGTPPKYDKQARVKALMQLETLMTNKIMSQQQAFLEQNKSKAGVQVTASGLQYKVIQAGTGATPKLTDTVKCNYRGTLVDGTEFDASAKHGGPASFPVNRVISGWTEALQLMKVGAKWQLFISADLAYGNNPPGPPIEAGSTLIFDIELLSIE